MKTKTLHIRKPSNKLIEFVHDLREEKERKQDRLLAEKNKYFNH